MDLCLATAQPCDDISDYFHALSGGSNSNQFIFFDRKGQKKSCLHRFGQLR
jgi:hypothetical protein